MYTRESEINIDFWLLFEFVRRNGRAPSDLDEFIGVTILRYLS